MKHLTEFLTESLATSQVFIVVKPGSLQHTQAVIELFAENGWTVSRTTTKQLLLKEAKQLYAVHKKESFYKDLCEYMASGPCRAFIIEKPNVLDPFGEVKKIKDEIREKYGESDMRNVLHSSDSKENMEKEASLFFQAL